jgi:hypothetical protein
MSMRRLSRTLLWRCAAVEANLVSTTLAHDKMSTNIAVTGIVTQFTIRAHPIGKVWGGIRIYDSSQKDAVFQALHDFVPSCGDDAKGAIILTNIVSAIKPLSFLIFYFYDGETHPDGGPLSGFLKVPYLISQTGTQSYSELVRATNLILIHDNLLTANSSNPTARERLCSIHESLSGYGPQLYSPDYHANRHDRPLLSRT